MKKGQQLTANKHVNPAMEMYLCVQLNMKLRLTQNINIQLYQKNQQIPLIQPDFNQN